MLKHPKSHFVKHLVFSFHNAVMRSWSSAVRGAVFTCRWCHWRHAQTTSGYLAKNTKPIYI